MTLTTRIMASEESKDKVWCHRCADAVPEEHECLSFKERIKHIQVDEHALRKLHGR